MPDSAVAKSRPRAAKRGEKHSDERLLDLVQRQTFRYFWQGAHPISGLARDRRQRLADPTDDAVAVGGSGFGVMAKPDAAFVWLRRVHWLLLVLSLITIFGAVADTQARSAF